MTSSCSVASMSVVSGPTVQPRPIVVAPRRKLLGSMTESSPIRTSMSMSVEPASTMLTPARR